MTRLALNRVSTMIGGRRVLHDVSFEAAGGTLIGLIGPNGAGKSSLLRTIPGLLPASEGQLTLDGQAIDRMKRRDLARNIAYLAQDDAVHWPLSAEAVVALGRTPHTAPLSRLRASDRQAIDRAMARTGIQEMSGRDVKRLSGGERARVLLARALAVEAPVLLVDEPVGALDPRHGLQIMALLREEAAQGACVIAVLHDLALASRFCDRLILLDQGRVAADGAPLDVLSPDSLIRHYAVTGHHGTQDRQRFVIPWQPVKARSLPPSPQTTQ